MAVPNADSPRVRGHAGAVFDSRAPDLTAGGAKDVESRAYGRMPREERRSRARRSHGAEAVVADEALIGAVHAGRTGLTARLIGEPDLTCAGLATAVGTRLCVADSAAADARALAGLGERGAVHAGHTHLAASDVAG